MIWVPIGFYMRNFTVSAVESTFTNNSRIIREAFREELNLRAIYLGFLVDVVTLLLLER
jgi:hypothetical protein